MKNSRFMVIEGLDGSGKTTQTELLAQHLRSLGQAPRVLSFPDYDSPSSALVKMYLAGQFGARPDDVNAYAATSFFAVDRFASYATHWKDAYLRGDIILANRYTTANAIHQCAKLPQGQWQSYTDWLFDLEYQKIGIPAPDLVVLLDVEPAVSQRLLAARYQQAGGQKDIHEQDVAYLERCHAAAHWCTQQLGWRLIHCTHAGQMRKKENIAKELATLVKEEML